MELQLAHFSVQQYLSSERLKQSFPEAMAGVGMIFQEGLKKCGASGFITSVCLAYLCHLGEQRPTDEIRSEFPLAQYSAQYWMDHAKPAEANKDIQDRILNFFLQQTHAYAVWGVLFDPDCPPAENPRTHGIPMATPIYYASLAGLHYTVEMLLEKGANANAQGGFHGNPLQAASASGHHKITQLLLAKGANSNAQGGYYGNALQAASAEGHNEIVQLLLAEGANVNAQGGFCGNALQAASARGHNEIAQLLLAKGANVNAQGGIYGNALQAASAEGHNEVVQLLLAEGANVNAQGGYYGNALQAASARGHNEIVQLLLGKGANVNA
jgi:hypothetical protein